MLERGDHQHPLIVGEDVFGAVAVVDVEIDNGRASDTMRGQRVRGPDGDVVEQAEAHRPTALGVVARRAHGTEGGPALLAHDEVGGQHDRAGRVEGGRQRMGVHRRVGVEEVQPGRGTLRLDRRDVVALVNAGDLLVRGRLRRVVAQVGVEPGADQPVPDRVQPVRALGVVRPHVVQQERRMCNVCSRHGFC